MSPRLRHSQRKLARLEAEKRVIESLSGVNFSDPRLSWASISTQQKQLHGSVTGSKGIVRRVVSKTQKLVNTGVSPEYVGQILSECRHLDDIEASVRKAQSFMRQHPLSDGKQVGRETLLYLKSRISAEGLVGMRALVSGVKPSQEPGSLGKTLLVAGLVAASGSGVALWLMPPKTRPQKPDEPAGIVQPQPAEEKPRPTPVPAQAPATAPQAPQTQAKKETADLDAFVAGSSAAEKDVRDKMLAKIRRVFSDTSKVDKRSKADIVRAYAKKYGFDADLYLKRSTQLSVDPLEGLGNTDVESDWKQGAKSADGAKSVAQLMDATGKAVWADCVRELVDANDFASWSKLVVKPKKAKGTDAEWKKEQWNALVAKRAAHKKTLASFDSDFAAAEGEMNAADHEARRTRGKKSKDAKARWRTAAAKRRKLRNTKAAIPGEWSGLTNPTYGPTSNINQALWAMQTYYWRDVGGLLPSSMPSADARRARGAGYNYGDRRLGIKVRALTTVTWSSLKPKLPTESANHGERVDAYYSVLSQVEMREMQKQDAAVQKSKAASRQQMQR